LPCLKEGCSRFDLWIAGGEWGAYGGYSGLRRQGTANRQVKREKEHGFFQNQTKGEW